MNRVFITLSFLMGVVVLISNYLVQFPISYFNLNEILTYGAFSYPIAFLITDIANRFYGKLIARKIVYVGFAIGISFTIIFSTNFTDLISIRIAIGSGTTFLFFSISFYATGVPWFTLSLGDLAVKIFVALLMLIPFRILLGTVKAV